MFTNNDLLMTFAIEDARENVIKYEGGGGDYKERLKELEEALVDLTKQRVEAAVKFAVRSTLLFLATSYLTATRNTYKRQSRFMMT